jgi:hypothetical protein
MAVPATTGQLRTSLAEMEIGDYIPMHYVYSGANSYYEFTTGSKAEANYIGYTNASGNVARYHWYMIKVDKGLLVADRVGTHTVSWNELNIISYIQGKKFTISGEEGVLRTIGGGNAYADAQGNPTFDANISIGAWPVDNEWDRFILQFPVDKIQEGKTLDDIFHHQGIWSFTQDTIATGTQKGTDGSTVVTNPNMRTIRGNENLTPQWKGFGGGTATVSGPLAGYRPVFEYKEV